MALLRRENFGERLAKLLQLQRHLQYNAPRPHRSPGLPVVLAFLQQENRTERLRHVVFSQLIEGGQCLSAQVFGIENDPVCSTRVVRHIEDGAGRFVIVESSQPGSWPIRKLFHLYMRWYVSRLGYLLSGNRSAYRYLAESASRFYTVEELRNLMLEVGFSKFSSRRLAFGAVAIHVATK